MLELNKIHKGNWIDLAKQLDDESIDMIITSPPYWGLRDYNTDKIIFDGDENCEHEWHDHHTPPKGGMTRPENMPTVGSNKREQSEEWRKKGYDSNFCTKCGAWKGQLGLEPHPNFFIKHLIDGFRILRQKLKPSGSLYLNLGDTFFGSMQGYGHKPGQGSGIQNSANGYFASSKQKPPMANKEIRSKWLTPKQKMLMPHRVAIALQDDGWILRNDIIWHKNNPMPSSVKDRLNTTFEYVFHFVKSKKYYYDLDAIRVPHKSHSIKRACRGISEENKYFKQKQGGMQVAEKYKGYDDMQGKLKRGELRMVHPVGKNPGDVWRISTKPFPQSHFAVFPQELLKIPIKSSLPEWVCKKCGKLRQRITKTEKQNVVKCNARGELRPPSGEDIHQTKSFGYKQKYNAIRTTLGWTDCGCGEGFEGGKILDPFNGAGTTWCAMLKWKPQCNYLGFELKKEYIELSYKRIKDFKEKLLNSKQKHL